MMNGVLMGLEFLLLWTMVKPWFNTMCRTSLLSKFMQASLQSNSFREDTESGDGETRDSFSDLLSDDSESDRCDGCSSEGGGSEQDNPWLRSDKLGRRYFQYFERSTPYGRVPLMDKINGLARQFPGLMTLRNVDLSPASWMAVAWYPIYHIPMGRTIKDLSTCFLTYHTLSSSFQDMDVEDDIKSPEKKRKEGESITLPPFGLATYKMQGKRVGLRQLRPGPR
ncbi:T15D22.8 [Salix purpurea]|uniref:T15D22.8 n=1 Tax=Salix purpurea TaxID=77065 RepID=A0A9Q0ZS58_SALPP|nr:T15D22.8 [Salix purpurea]